MKLACALCAHVEEVGDEGRLLRACLIQISLRACFYYSCVLV